MVCVCARCVCKYIISPYRCAEAGGVGVVGRRVPQHLLEKERILEEARAGDVQEAPQVQLPAERRLQAALEEVAHAPVLLLLVQQRLGRQLTAAVLAVCVQTWQLHTHKTHT